MEIPHLINLLHAEMTAWRHDLHAHPELGFEEHRTSEFVAGKLAEFGCEVHRHIGKTGVVGVLPIAFRAFKEPVSYAARRKRGQGMRFAWASEIVVFRSRQQDIQPRSSDLA
jgi:hypothetical protein